MADRYLKFSEIQPGDTETTVALVGKIEEVTASNGSPYCNINLSDGVEEITAKLWQKKKSELPFKEEDLIGVTLTGQVYNDAKSYIVKKTHNPPADAQKVDYIRKPAFAPKDMYADILRNVQSVSKGVPRGALLPIGQMVADLYKEYEEKLLYWSAAKAYHHNLYGGLLYHTFTMVRTGLCVARVHKSLDAEILLCGLALHDIGKLKELETSSVGAADYTVDGNLFGHLLIGVQMVDEYIARKTAEYGQNPYHPAQIAAVKHIIASHHGEQAYGSIVEPRTAEASVAHLIDLMDAKVYTYAEVNATLEPGEVGKDFRLGHVYRMPDIEY